jgi:AcrR family transcriptional regulator
LVGKSRREANIEATRAALLAAARHHFARHGYARTELSQIAADAEVTTGAIYHHFVSKKGLFQAVAEQLEAEILAAAAARQAADMWQGLRAGFESLIDVCAAPDIQRIIFIEAPQVIGPEEWREIELRYAFGATRQILEHLMADGTLRRFPVDLVARTLLSLLSEAAAEIARTPGDPKIRAQVGEMVTRVLDAFESG